MQKFEYSHSYRNGNAYNHFFTHVISIWLDNTGVITAKYSNTLFGTIKI